MQFQASSVDEYVKHVEKGFACFYSSGGNMSVNCTAIPARSALYLLSYTFAVSALMVILRFKDGLVYLAIIIGFSSLLSTVFWSLFLDISLTVTVNFAPRIDAADSIYLLAGLGVVVLAVASFVYLGFSPTRSTVSVPARTRQSSLSRNITLRFPKPERPAKQRSISESAMRKKMKKSKSAPNFNIYL